MPIQVDVNIRHLDQAEFGEIAYDVMDHIFTVHNKMGRFLHEGIYQNAVAARVGDDSQTRVRIEVRFEDFLKEYDRAMPRATEGPLGRAELGLQGHNDRCR